jgi:serine/threonine protein phosphatase 1
MASRRTTDGRVIYAIGDIHGRLDLLELMLARIAEDVKMEGANKRGQLIFLGDYVDRGPAARGVLDLLCSLQTGRGICFIKGNHEAALANFLQDAEFGRAWCAHGGAETVESYGLRAPAANAPAPEWAELQREFVARLPEAHRTFLEGLPVMAEAGDYVFVHAGLRPGVPLHRQKADDLLWIREDFIQDTRKLPKVVVHGHTPTQVPVWDGRRIGVDTGAYVSGILTAVRICDDDVRFLTATL